MKHSVKISEEENCVEGQGKKEEKTKKMSLDRLYIYILERPVAQSNKFIYKIYI